MGAFQGQNYRNYQIPRFAKVTGATAGFAFNHATEAFSAGLRKPGKLSKRSTGPMDAAGRPIMDKVSCQIEFDMLQQRIADIRNIHLLVLSGPHQWLFQTAKGQYFAFTDNDTGSGTFTAPAGSSLVGGLYTFQLTDKERTLHYTGTTDMANTEWDYMVTNSGSAATGGSGGTTAGLAAHPYARGNYVRSGIASMSVNGVTVGAFNRPRITIKTKAAEDGANGRDHRNRPIPAFGEADCEFYMLQTTANDILGASTAEQTDYTVQFGTWNDETFKFTTGAGGLIVEEQEISDSNTYVKLSLKGSFPLTTDTSAMDIGVSSASVLECKLIAY